MSEFSNIDSNRHIYVSNITANFCFFITRGTSPYTSARSGSPLSGGVAFFLREAFAVAFLGAFAVAFFFFTTFFSSSTSSYSILFSLFSLFLAPFLSFLLKIERSSFSKIDLGGETPLGEIIDVSPLSNPLSSSS